MFLILMTMNNKMVPGGIELSLFIIIVCYNYKFPNIYKWVRSDYSPVVLYFNQDSGIFLVPPSYLTAYFSDTNHSFT